MRNKTENHIMVKFIQFIVILVVICCFTSYSLADDKELKIGVLAKRGKDHTLKKWNATADYLTENIPDYSFKIVPLGFEEINSNVANNSIDFILVNPSIYVDLEILYGISRLATLKNLGPGGGFTVFGGVVFVKSDRNDINTLEDLKGKKSFMAVKETSLGGFQMAWLELKKLGIDPYKDFSKLTFRSKHDSVVYAVGNNEVDAGTVRTDTLERMTTEGKINVDDFKVISERISSTDVGFPYKHSTTLYPEWPFAKLTGTSLDIAQEVAIALMEMKPNDKAAIMGRNAGWTVPLSYEPVRNLMKELKIGFFRDFGKLSLEKIIKQYWRIIVFSFLFIILLIIFIVYTIRMNRRLTLTQKELHNEIAERKHVENVLAENRDKLSLQLEKYTDALEHQERIKKYHALISLLITTLKLKPLLQKALDSIIELTGSKFGVIYLVEKKERQIVPYVFHAISPSKLENTNMGETTHGQVISDRKIRHIKELPVNCELKVEMGIVSVVPNEIVMLPLISKNEALGVIVLGTMNQYPDDDIPVLSHMADQISIMLENALANERVERLSILDGLTDIDNRRYLNIRLGEEVSKVARSGNNVSIILIDIDYFKNINDNFGHQVGDDALCAVSKILQNLIRNEDVLGRFGGEEFLIILPLINMREAGLVADKLRVAVEEATIPSMPDSSITISLGVAGYSDSNAKSLDDLLNKADKALYQAKDKGRNRCELAKTNA